jgi:hypothetical protein
MKALTRNLGQRVAVIHAMATGIAVLGVVAGCGTTEPRPTQPVGIHLASATPAFAAAAAAGPLQITSLRLVVSTASLGAGDQFGCIDCQGNAEDAPATPKLISVPLTGGTILVATELTSPGTYSQAEIALARPAAATVAGTPNWPAGATLLIEGTHNGTAFAIPLTIEGSFLETLNPPVVVTNTSTPSTITVTATLPVTSWFTSNGVSLDPAVAAQRAVIEANIRRSFQSVETPSREP